MSLSTARRFKDGEVYEEAFSTAKGWIVFSCVISIRGRELHLLDVSVEPLHFPYLEAGISDILRVRRQILLFARGEGYTTFVLKAWRRTGAHPNRWLRMQGRT